MDCSVVHPGKDHELSMRKPRDAEDGADEVTARLLAGGSPPRRFIALMLGRR
jgi:hypothetical protein